MSRGKAVAGIADHCGWAVVVCVADGEVLDRRRIELVEPGLPCLPHHSEGQRLPIDEAVALVERVRASAEVCARKALEALPAGVSGIAIRRRWALPPTIAERITDYRAQTRADSAMYREALAKAARALVWFVSEYEVKTVLQGDFAARLETMGAALGRPWTKDHRVAAAAAMAAVSPDAQR
jgi:hypothetical protein